MKTLSVKRSGASPGGPVVSVAKRRRLAALDNALSGPAHKASTAAPTADTPLQSAGPTRATVGASATPSAEGGDGEFPYNRLGDAVLDGSLSAALANAKAAAAAAAKASRNVGSSTLGSFTTRSSVGNAGKSTACAFSLTVAAVAAAATAAATAAEAGGDSVAAEILGQLVGTNPRASSSDLRNLLAQRLHDRSVMLDNPTAPLKVNKSFSRRATRYSAKLRSVNRTKSSKQRAEQIAQRAPSYKTMLRMHELWMEYTQSLARSAATAGGGASGGSSNGAGIRAPDIHGAMLSVVKHPNPQLMGATGVVLKHKSNSLHLVTPGDRVRVVPLKGCVAHYTMNGATLQLSG